ncbi:MAG: hypothetical protein WCI36_03515 [bacterium]
MSQTEREKGYDKFIEKLHQGCSSNFSIIECSHSGEVEMSKRDNPFRPDNLTDHLNSFAKRNGLKSFSVSSTSQ